MTEDKERPTEKIKRVQGEKPQTSTSEKTQWPAGKKHVPPFKKGTFPGIEDWKPGLGSLAPKPKSKQLTEEKAQELPKVPPFIEEGE